MRPLNINFSEIAFGHQKLFFINSGFDHQLPRRIRDKTLSPELNPAIRIAFVTDAVGDGHVNAVRNRVRSLNCLPR